MFPNILDNAIVYFYTQKRNYGSVFYDNGKIEYIHYLAICSYDNNEYTYSIVTISLKLLLIIYLIVLRNVRV